MSQGQAPGAVMAPTGSTTTTDADPLAPKAPEQKKTRFSARAKEESAKKAQLKAAKVNEKVSAKPVPMTADETTTQKTQAAPLGLNGDTAKKPKKQKVKGAPKERIQNAPPKPPPPPLEETPAKAPNRGTPLEGTPSADRPAPSAAPAPAAPAPTAPASGDTPAATQPPTN
jgi:peptidyl-prolyl cis-trans isomerase SurA